MRKDRVRNKTRQAKLGKFWCWGCDGCLVWEGQKCPRCGFKDWRKRAKKPAPQG